MAQDPAETMFYRQRFTDVDQLGEAVRRWDLELRQLDRGRFGGDLVQLGTRAAFVSGARFGRVIEQRGSAPSGQLTFGVLAASNPGLVWHRQKVTADQLLVFPSDGVLEATSHPGFHVYPITLSTALLGQVAETIGVGVSLPGSTAPATLFAPDALDHLRALLHRLLQVVTTRPARLADPAIRHEFEFELPRLVLLAAAAADPRPLKRAPRAHASLHSRVETYLAASAAEAVTVADLCRAVGTSEWTLRRLFLDRFGVPPKAYLQAGRLNAARRALRLADPASTRVADTANEFGFWHMGQFAADYQRMFGELPSVTIRRRSSGAVTWATGA
jgi:AraC family ethanolamine operon transcriptional activator